MSLLNIIFLDYTYILYILCRYTSLSSISWRVFFWGGESFSLQISEVKLQNVERTTCSWNFFFSRCPSLHSATCGRLGLGNTTSGALQTDMSWNVTRALPKLCTNPLCAYTLDMSWVLWAYNSHPSKASKRVFWLVCPKANDSNVLHTWVQFVHNS